MKSTGSQLTKQVKTAQSQFSPTMKMAQTQAMPKTKMAQTQARPTTKVAGCQTSTNGRDFGCQYGFDKMWNPDDYEETDIYDFNRFIHHLFSRDFKKDGLSSLSDWLMYFCQ